MNVLNQHDQDVSFCGLTNLFCNGQNTVAVHNNDYVTVTSLWVNGAKL